MMTIEFLSGKGTMQGLIRPMSVTEATVMFVPLGYFAAEMVMLTMSITSMTSVVNETGWPAIM
jgi:hypothetical protein